MRIKFTKMSGAGNDFILLGPRYSLLVEKGSQIAVSLCRRRLSVGADGLILVEKSAQGLYMHYFNRDGSRAEFCGNGARCFVLYCSSTGIAGKRVRFKSDAGDHVGEVVGENLVRVKMDMPNLLGKVKITANGESFEIFHVDAGVPHGVIFTSSVDGIDVETTGRKIRNHPEFQPHGVNVDFVERTGVDTFYMRTYERGVESETLACGSGCVATALVAMKIGLAGSLVNIYVRSGEMLTVELEKSAQGEDIWLKGHAQIVFEGEIEIEE